MGLAGPYGGAGKRVNIEVYFVRYNANKPHRLMAGVSILHG